MPSVAGNVVLAQDFSSPGNSLAHTDATTGAVQLGLDYTLCKNFLVGLTFGYGHTDATLDIARVGQRHGADPTRPETAYASYADKGWYANGIASYGFNSYTLDRNISIGAFSGTAHSAPTGDQIVGNLDGGYDFHHNGWTFGPTAGLQYVHLDVNGFDETGATDANLTTTRDEADSLRSRLGARVRLCAWPTGAWYGVHRTTSMPAFGSTNSSIRPAASTINSAISPQVLLPSARRIPAANRRSSISASMRRSTSKSPSSPIIPSRLGRIITSANRSRAWREG